MKRHTILWLTVGAIVAAVVIFGAIIASKAVAGDPHATDPLETTGAWHAKVNDAHFVATITGDGIEIHLVTENSDGLYWKGTFPVPPTAHQGDMFTVVSVGDTEAMQASLYGSQDESKAFEYKDHKINFKMTMMGVETFVHLEKGSDVV